MRFHCLSIPHTITNKEYNACAFTQKVLKFGKMMTKLGHEVIHYGNEESDLICSEHVTVTTKKDLEYTYGNYDYKEYIPKFDYINDHIYKVFTNNTWQEIERRKQKYDFILAFFGIPHQKICNNFDKRYYIQVEPGVGYTSTFAACKVFESYSLYHALQSDFQNKLGMWWYDAVIPNYFDPEDFNFNSKKNNYFLYIGRLITSKGIDIAVDVTKKIGAKLIVAGQKSDEFDPKNFPSHVCYVGYADIETRKHLMANAIAGFVPSRYAEPFGGVQIEMLMSGTPTITTDWGAFTENNIHGVTGYRCRNFEQFIWAAKNIEKIDPYNCRKWAENFTLDKVGLMYQEYFDMLYNFYKYRSWYESDAQRTNLNWLSKKYNG